VSRAAFPFAGWAGESVRLLKYSSEWGRAEAMGDQMVSAARSLEPIDVVIPVPLHHQKRSLRGYNQSTLLAARVATALSVPMVEGLVRVRETDSQVSLDREHRRTNMIDAFAVSLMWRPVPGLRILLVDDVRTTSATINACAMALDAVQPATICCLTFALDLPARELSRWLEAVRT
jgi:predicted amidophosphoribosyltransferase